MKGIKCPILIIVNSYVPNALCAFLKTYPLNCLMCCHDEADYGALYFCMCKYAIKAAVAAQRAELSICVFSKRDSIRTLFWQLLTVVLQNCKN